MEENEIRTCGFDEEFMKGLPCVKYVPGAWLMLDNKPLYPEGDQPYFSRLTPEEQDAITQQKMQYLGYSIDELTDLLDKSKAEEHDDVFRVHQALRDWQKQAAKTHAIMEAMEYLKRVSYKPSFTNAWQDVDPETNSRISYGKVTHQIRSNSIYEAEIFTTEIHDYSYRGKGDGVEAGYYIRIVFPDTDPKAVRGYAYLADVKKSFWGDDSKEQAMKYLEGRKSAFDKKYFSEDNPYVPKDYWREFCVGGFFLPYYRKDPALA